MRTLIYYFTGSGNSLVVARDLAAATGGEVVSIAALMEHQPDGPIVPQAEAVGLAFPVYYANMGGSGVPRIVERFVARLEAHSAGRERYVFAVCAHAGAPEATLGNLARMVAARGAWLTAGWAVQLAHSHPTAAKLRHMLNGAPLHVDAAEETEQRRPLWTAWQAQLPEIARAIRERAPVPLPAEGGLKVLRSAFLALQQRMALARYRQLAGMHEGSLAELIPRSDTAFRVRDRCNGCGTCVRMCPVDNIVLVDSRPTWQHRCETCYACFQWCPQEAIGGAVVEFEKRYHHPAVQLADMLRRRLA